MRDKLNPQVLYNKKHKTQINSLPATSHPEAKAWHSSDQQYLQSALPPVN